VGVVVGVDHRAVGGLELPFGNGVNLLEMTGPKDEEGGGELWYSFSCLEMLRVGGDGEVVKMGSVSGTLPDLEQ
jgi:hypothetical protein